MEELQRKEYPALLTSLTPTQALNILNDRVRHIGQLNNHIADWLQERRRVEDAYVQSLRKLAAKHSVEDSLELGVFSTPWQKIVNATEAVAASHQRLANKIEADVERPLREYATHNREMQSMDNMVGNLTTIAKDIDMAQKKANKLRDKGSKAKASAVAEVAQELEKAELHWDSQAPYVFEQLQTTDESRLDHLRDVLTQFQTHEVDQVVRSRVTAEETLNVLLNIETTDEIQTWALKIRGGDFPPPMRKLSNVGSPPRNLAPPPVPSTPSNTEDDHSQKSGSMKEKHSSNPLKRFGTVLSRRRQSHHPYGRGTSPEGKPSSNLASALSGFGKGKAKERDTLSPSADRPITPISRLSPGPRASEASVSPSQSHLTSRDAPNGSTTESTGEATGGTTVNGSSSLQSPIPGLKEPLHPSTTVEIRSEPQKDSEGFSVPPSAVDAITEAEREAGLTQPESNPAPQFKLDIRNAPIQEEEADADAATANLVNTLRAQALQPKRQSTLRGRRDVRNTIFVTNPAVAPDLQALQYIGEMPSSAIRSSSVPGSASSSTTLPTLLPPQPSSPAFKVPHRSLMSEENAPSDTQSIRSGRSLSSAASITVKHPELHEPGLNASLVETVSAWFDHGAVTKAMVIGQVALAYNPIDISAGPFGTENIRLENFSVLEKVAPNPAFIEQPTDTLGSYTVDLTKIPKTSVAFHYQLHINDASISALAPITLTTAWKSELTQTSAILHYSLNPKFNLGGASSMIVSNLVLVIRLDPSSRATSAQSKPSGTFSREKSLVYWRLGDVTFTSDQPAQTIRVRFFTDGESKPGNTEARWEISGAQSLNLGSGLSVSMSVPLSEAKQDGEADPFADTDEFVPPVSPGVGWKPVPSVKKISSGTYVGA